MQVSRLIDARVTYMELRTSPPPVPTPPAEYDLRLRCIPDIPLDLYRFLYDSIGRPHHWTSRHLPDRALAAAIHAAGMSIHVLEAGRETAGWFELEADKKPGRTRIVHFGIMPEFRGRGLARYLLREAVAAAFATDASIVTLETNTLDHPAALKLYLEAGFVGTEVRLVSTPALES